MVATHLNMRGPGLWKLNTLLLTEMDYIYGGISMTKFNNQELISNYPNWTCINPKLNGNKPILCSKSEMHQTEAEGQKPVSGILSGKRRNANRHNTKRQKALISFALLVVLSQMPTFCLSE